MANWMFDPPVSTPISRITAIEASRIRWYSLSVERLGRGHGDRVAGVDAHRVEVLDRADDDAVVVLVAHHLHLELFPADHRFFQQHLVDGREVQAVLHQLVELLAVVGDARAGAAEGEAGPHHAGQPDLLHRLPGLVAGCRPSGRGGTSRPIRSMAALNWSRASALSITAALAPIISTPYFSSTPCWCRSIARFKPGLAAERGQQGVGPLGLDHLGHDLPGQRLDVRAVGHLRVGHDRGRIGVDQHDLVPLLAQGLARLGARVVELAGLPDDDRPGTDQQDLLDVVATWHCKSLP